VAWSYKIKSWWCEEISKEAPRTEAFQEGKSGEGRGKHRHESRTSFARKN